MLLIEFQYNVLKLAFLKILMSQKMIGNGMVLHKSRSLNCI